MWLTPASVGLNASPRSSDRYVLLVDDHSPSLDTLRRLVEDQGYSCQTAGSAMEAIARCGVDCPWLVVTDLNMPRLDGRGLAGWLRQACPTTKVVLLTSECLDTEAIRRMGELFAAVLSKPLNVALFLSLLAELSTGGAPWIES